MGQFRKGFRHSLWLFALLLLVGCTGRAGAGAQSSLPGAALRAGSEPAVTYADPFRYCAAVGTIDAPDARYVGPKVPMAIAQGLQKAFGRPDTAPLEPFLRGTFWRCMDGQVFACTVGANLPCQEKADTSRTPSPAMGEYCRANPNSEFIPAYVTGRATVYAWRCRQGSPAIARQVARPDARGYRSDIWYRIEPPT